MSKFETRFEADGDTVKICAVYFDTDERRTDNRSVDDAPHVSAESALQNRKERARFRRKAAMDSLLANVASVVGQRQSPGIE